jgi:hypothetical protein
MNCSPKYFSALLFAAFAFLVLTPEIKAARIVVSNDEWMFNDRSLASNDDTQFALNITGWLTGGSGNILIVSNNDGVDGYGSGNTLLIALLAAHGYTVTVATTTPTSLTALSGYQAVFLAGQGPDGNPVSNTLLINYVNSGGSVFVEGGTGAFASATAEAAAWNQFLNNFGLSFDSSYNTVCGGTPPGCADPNGIDVSPFKTQPPYGPALFAGVNSITIADGNNVLNLLTDPFAQVFTDPSGNGLYGAVEVINSSDTSFQVRYAANLNLGESYIDVTNTGGNGASLLGPGFGAAQAGNICVNVYAFDPSEEMIACCSCLVTPDQTVNLGVNADLTVKTLTGVPETSVTVKLLASLNTTTPLGGVAGVYGCTNSAATVVTGAAASGTNTVAPFGMAAWGTTLHPGVTAASGVTATETPFTPATLSSGAAGSNNELQSLTGRCAAIIGNASGYGICTSCQAGALGGKKL